MANNSSDDNIFVKTIIVIIAASVFTFVSIGLSLPTAVNWILVILLLGAFVWFLTKE